MLYSGPLASGQYIRRVSKPLVQETKQQTIRALLSRVRVVADISLSRERVLGIAGEQPEGFRVSEYRVSASNHHWPVAAKTPAWVSENVLA